MVDWNLVAEIAGGGFGTTIFVLVVLSLISWIIGRIVQRTTKSAAEGKENSDEG